MDLQDVNYVYEGASKDLKNKSKKVTNMKSEIETLVKNIRLNRAKAVIAEDHANQPGVTEADKTNYLKEMDEKNKLADELEKLLETRRNELTELQAEVQNLQKKVDGIIAEVSQNPEVAQLIKENIETKRQQKAKTKDMKKKFEARNEKDKEKKELETRKNKLAQIMEVLNKNPKAKKALVEAIKLRKRKNELDEELKQCTDVNREKEIKAELYEIEKKDLPKVQKNFSEHFGKEKIGITWADIDDIINNGLTLDKKGNIDLKSTLKNYSKNLDTRINDRTEEIANLDKEIAPYRDLLGVQAQPQVQVQAQPQPQVQVQGQQQGDNSSEAGENEGQEQGEEKPKWWQFGKRFKAWIEKRKQKSLPEAEEEQNEPEPKKEQPVEISKERRETLNKYKVVQQIEKDAWEKMIADAQQNAQQNSNENEGR